MPWYAPKKYWQFYPNDTATIAPHPSKPVDGVNIAMQSVMRGWSTPKKNQGPLSCKYTDLCGEIYPGAPFAHDRPGITTEYPFDNSSFPDWKALELRRAYWAALSYTDANIGRVLDALDASPFKSTTVVAMWVSGLRASTVRIDRLRFLTRVIHFDQGDHGYALGDNGRRAFLFQTLLEGERVSHFLLPPLSPVPFRRCTYVARRVGQANKLRARYENSVHNLRTWSRPWREPRACGGGRFVPK